MSNHLAEITQALSEAALLIGAHNSNVDAAQAAHDPSLSETGNRDRIEAARQQSAKRLTQQLTLAHGTVKNAASRARAEAARARPNIDDTDPAALTRVAHTWEYQIRPQLDAGKPLRDVIADTTEAEHLLVIERHAGGWIAARDWNVSTADAIDGADISGDQLPEAVSKQLMAISDEDTADAIRTDQLAQTGLARMDVVHDAVARHLDGTERPSDELEARMTADTPLDAQAITDDGASGPLAYTGGND